jgi:hypothetical protein
MSYELDTIFKITPALADDWTVQYSMGIWCRSAWYIDRVQLYLLIIRHLRQLMIVRYRCYTVLLTAGASEISLFVVRSPSFAGFCELNWQLQFHCC